jgi:hypothetical protein
MKKCNGFIGLLALISPLLVAQVPLFQFVVRVQDQSGRSLKDVSIENYHVRTGDDGMATLMLAEGKSSLNLYRKGYIAQTVEVITSRLVKDNQATFTLNTIPVDARKILVRGAVTTQKNSYSEPVFNTQVKLFYSGHELITTSGVDGSFTFQIPDVKISNYEWMIHFYHPDYNYREPVRFTVPKTNLVELSANLISKTPVDSATVHHAFFIIHPIPWKTNTWDVLDVNGCQCVLKNDRGFQITVPYSKTSVHLKVVRKGYDDVDLIKSPGELQQITSQYLYMKKPALFPISRVSLKTSGNYSAINGGLLVTPFSQVYGVLWHPSLSGAVTNRLAVVAGFSGKQSIETTNTYRTLNGFVGTVQSRYMLVESGMLGCRYYWNDFRQRAPNVFLQGQISLLHQEPVALFREDNFTAERSDYRYVMPTLMVGVRKNFSSILALECSIFMAQANIRSQSFTFNYFGNAYATEDRNQLFNVGFNTGLVFSIPH